MDPKGADDMGNTAKEISEKRESTRRTADIGIVCQPYSSARAIRQCTGVLRNYSNGGIYIETPYQFNPGTILVIRTTPCAPPSSVHFPGEGLRTICLAEIKWRRDLSDRDTACYGMGLGYLN